MKSGKTEISNSEYIFDWFNLLIRKRIYILYFLAQNTFVKKKKSVIINMRIYKVSELWFSPITIARVLWNCFKLNKTIL